MAKSRTEEFKFSGESVIQKIKDIINEGNVRRISVKDKNGKVIAEFPLTFGVIGAVVAPVVAAIGAIAALASECTIVVEREDTDQTQPDEKGVEKK